MSLNFTRAKEQRELISSALDWMNAGADIALITLVNIEGSAPYPIGTQMLVSSSGEYKGQITGGCAEQAIAEQAVSAIDLGKNSSRRYGLNSPYFDIQLPCGSGIDVYIDVMISQNELIEIRDTLECRFEVDRVIDPDGIAFEKRYFPNQRLVLLGQGPILIHTAKFALESGFDVLCVVQNTSTMELAINNGLEPVSLSSSLQLGAVCDEFTGVVSLFHEHDYEESILVEALASRAFYLGALGSRRTHAQRLSRLQELGIGEHELARINGPVGIDINANTPAQIAISIVAQAIERLDRVGEG